MWKSQGFGAMHWHAVSWPSAEMGQTSLGLGLGGITTPQKPLGVSAIGVALDDASGFFCFVS